MQKLLKSMINSIKPRYIQYLDQYLQWLGEYMRLNFRINRGLAWSSLAIRPN